jgi:hypothetical protein
MKSTKDILKRSDFLEVNKSFCIGILKPSKVNAILKKCKRICGMDTELLREFLLNIKNSSIIGLYKHKKKNVFMLRSGNKVFSLMNNAKGKNKEIENYLEGVTLLK